MIFKNMNFVIYKNALTNRRQRCLIEHGRIHENGSIYAWITEVIELTGLKLKVTGLRGFVERVLGKNYKSPKKGKMLK